MTPRARRDGLLEQPLDDELLVYDPERARGHCLNRTAALVWRHADGAHTVADLAAVLRRDLDEAADEDLVCHTLDRLRAADLLEDTWTRSADAMRAARRQFVRRVGLIGVVSLLLPVVTSITAPEPAEAGISCGSSGTCTGFLPGWRYRP